MRSSRPSASADNHPVLVTAYRLLPATLTLFILCFFAAPLPLPYLQGVAPQIAVISIFYWGTYRESIFPYWFVFLYGLLHDSLLGIPIGTSSFIYLVTYVLVVLQRGFVAGGNFLRTWALFSVFILGVELAYWFIGTVCFGEHIKLANFVMQAVLTVCVYPCFHGLYGFIFYVITRNTPLIRHAK
ncbi:hypothetical protein GC177_10205 [bacterium]|nr:hypothetical protein [bacterium]